MASRFTFSPPSVEERVLRREIIAPGVRAELITLRGAPEVQFSHVAEASFVALNNFIRHDGETEIPGFKKSTQKDVRGSLTFVPAGGVIQGWTKHSQSASFTAVYLQPHQEDFEVSRLAQLKPGLHFQDRRLAATVHKFEEVLRGDEVGDVAYLETLGLLLAHELCNARFHERSLHQGGLAPSQLARIKQYVHDHIGTDITVSDLADLAGLSRYHFIRAFRQAAGVSPYQYVLSERVEIAKDLLGEVNANLEEISQATGFKNTVQLSRAFRKLVGLTPARYRRIARG